VVNFGVLHMRDLPSWIQKVDINLSLTRMLKLALSLMVKSITLESC